MNPIQRFYLKMFSPVGNFMKDNLAKRGSIFTKFANFFAIGSREYGVHPTTNILKYLNSLLIQHIKVLWTHERASKTIWGNGNYSAGYWSLLRVFNYLFGTVFLFAPYYLCGITTYDRN